MKRTMVMAAPLCIISLVLTTQTIAGDIKDRLSLGFNVSSQKLYGDNHVGTFEFGGNPLDIRLNFKPYAFLGTDFGYARAKAATGSAVLTTELVNLGFKLGYRFLHTKRVTPLAYVGVGLLSFRDFEGDVFGDGYGAFGTGVELFLHDKLGLNLTADYRISTGDDFDGSRLGEGRDNFLNLSAGLQFYLGNRRAEELEEYLQLWRASDLQPVETVQAETVAEDESVAHQTSEVERMQKLAQQREELLHSIAEKDDNISLLKLKLSMLNEQAQEIQDRAEIERLLARSNDGNQENQEYMAQYQTALQYYREQNFTQARELLKSVLEQYPFHTMTSNTLYWLGESHFSAGEYRAAATAFEKSLSLSNPDEKFRNKVTRLMLGLSYWNAGEVVDARLELQKLLQTEPHEKLDALTRTFLKQLDLL